MRTKVPDFLKYLLVLVMWLQVGKIHSQSNVKYTYINTEDQKVILTNLGDVSQDIGGYWFCLGPGAYIPISQSITASGLSTEDRILEPGASIMLNYDRLNPVSGGLALFANANFESEDPSIVLDFVQWGSGGHIRTEQAVTAGRWNNANEFLTVPSPYVTSVGGSISEWSTCNTEAGSIAIDRSSVNSSTLVSQGDVNAIICIDGVPDPISVNVSGDVSGTNTGWMITDTATGEILGLPSSGPFDLEGAGTGLCSIYHITYEVGVVGREVGMNMSDLGGCFDLSNPITVLRAAPNAGTVSIDAAASMAANSSTLVNGDVATICIDNNVAAPITVVRSGEESNLSYRYVITDDQNNILNITNSNAIDLSGAGAGVCRIWGWSYRGVADNGAGFINGPLADLEAANCSDISDNFATVVRLTGEDCGVLSTNDFEDVSLNIYPNPVSNILNLSGNLSSFNDLTVEIYNVRGAKVASQKIDQNNMSVNLQDLSDGLYLVNLIDGEKGLLTTKKVLKRQ